MDFVAPSQAPDESVRDQRRKPPGEPFVLSIFSPAAYDIVTRCFLELRNQPWDIARIVLQIAVHRHDNIAPRQTEPGGERSGLAEPAVEFHNGESRVILRGHLQRCGGTIGAAIVNDDHLVTKQFLVRDLLQLRA